jgi:hypothetical protein
MVQILNLPFLKMLQRERMRKRGGKMGKELKSRTKLPFSPGWRYDPRQKGRPREITLYSRVVSPTVTKGPPFVMVRYTTRD